MATVLATPGVYIEEKSAFASSVVPVGTAIPVFLGYTQKAARGTKSLKNVPTRISSFAEFEQFFGGAPKVMFEISEDSSSVNGYSLAVDPATRYLLHAAIKFFYSNGGADCYVLSVGDYSAGVSAKDFNDEATGSGLPQLLKYNEPTLLVIPEAILLPKAECFSLQQTMLSHCGYATKNRFAILDVFDGAKERTYADDDVINQFREGVGANFLQWGAAYYPFVQTTIIASGDVNFTNISNTADLIEILSKDVDDDLENGRINEARANAIKDELAKIETATTKEEVSSLQATLKVVSAKLNSILTQISESLNLLPASSAMAGVYTMVDSSVNVAKAPANLSLGSVISPSVQITSDTQEELNLPLNGKAINAIRTFQGKGVLVWGARTLDGNSQDWRYISVRRTMTFLEQSIKAAAEGFVFEPNNSTTWSTLKATVTNFLLNQWQSGILAGQSPDDAFSVEIGLGVTMTPNDILDGLMKMTIKVAIVRPAEFIVITFEQQQQKS
uniref:phage tail sheath family protein n=1 Tax=Algoriphagus sp. TaxID=1872435 RepID=UPI004048BE1C